MATFIIAGQFKGRKILTPKGEQTRPSASQLRESLFNICQNHIVGAKFLDLFAGSGAMGLEALSRGADSVAFVEGNKEAAKCIRQNIETFGGMDKCRLYQGDVFRFLEYFQKENNHFDIIFADPPYQKGYAEKVLCWIDQSTLLGSDGLLFIEEAYGFQPDAEKLISLTLLNSRKISAAALQQYMHK